MAVEIEALRRRIDEREINVEELRKSILEPVRRICLMIIIDDTCE